jgi:hypothetical protein
LVRESIQQLILGEEVEDIIENLKEENENLENQNETRERVICFRSIFRSRTLNNCSLSYSPE